MSVTQCWQKQVKSSLGPVAFGKKQPMPAFCEKQGKKQGKKQAIRLEVMYACNSNCQKSSILLLYTDM